MNAIQTCPSPNVLQAMLAGRASENEFEELGRHLDECEGCRTRFDDFARNQRVSAAGMARIASAMQSPALRVALAKLARTPWADEKNEPGERKGPLETAQHPPEPPVSPPGLGLPSGYLEHSNDPLSLGKLGSYEIIERIGSGGMAVVFKGREPRLNRTVAIKVLAPHLAANGTARQRFFREAQAAAAVVHDHVVTIHAVEEANGLPILVMQYVPGLSLREKIDKCGPLDVRRILRIALQAASGLAAAHAQGLIHRDIKPENILLENGIERVRITDFGLATAADDVALTQTGFLAGTPQYMSPEQAQGRPIDRRSDLFSLGSVVYEMCTGRAAFRSSNPYAAIHRVCNEEPRPIRQLNPDIPTWLCQIVDRLLAKNANERFQTAQELIEELQARLIALQNPEQVEHVNTGSRFARPARSPSIPVEHGGSHALHHSGRDVVVAPAVLLLIASGLTFLSGPFMLAAALSMGGGSGIVLFAYSLLCCFVGLTMFVCGLLMLRRNSYPAAICGAVLAMLPITPFFPLTFLAGLFAFVMLQREDVKRAFVSDTRLRPMTYPGAAQVAVVDEHARVNFAGPALGLQGAAGLAIFFAATGMLMISLPLAIDIIEGDPGSLSPPLWVLAFAGMFGVFPGVVALFQFASAAKAIQTNSVVAARIAAVCAILPISPAWLLGLPMAVWMWVEVHRRWAIERSQRNKSPFLEVPRQFAPGAGYAMGTLLAFIVIMFVVVVGVVGIKYVSKEATPMTSVHFIETPIPPPLAVVPSKSASPTVSEDSVVDP